MKNLAELKKELLADGIIDANEVKELEEYLYADGKIDREEADFLFEINDAVSGKNNHESWKSFFVKALTSHVLEDEETPDVIDKEETEWLMDRIGKDGKCDENEKALIRNLKAKSRIYPMVLDKLIE